MKSATLTGGLVYNRAQWRKKIPVAEPSLRVKDLCWLVRIQGFLTVISFLGFKLLDRTDSSFCFIFIIVFQ